MVFSIDTDNNITALDAAPAAQEGLVAFATEKGFTKATAEWPISRLVEVWNSFAGVVPFDDLKPVKKFENRTRATRRIWAVIQKLATTDAAVEAPADLAAPTAPQQKKAPKASKASKKAPKAKTAEPAKAAGAPREGTAKANVIAMLQRKGGATLDAIRKATSWQAHTVRGFISILGSKQGMKIDSSKREDGARVYEAR